MSERIYCLVSQSVYVSALMHGNNGTETRSQSYAVKDTHTGCERKQNKLQHMSVDEVKALNMPSPYTSITNPVVGLQLQQATKVNTYFS